MISFRSLRSRLSLGLFFCAAMVPPAASPVEAHSSSGTLSLADLQHLVSEQGCVIRSFRLEGVVRAVVPQRRLIALQDESATALLELPAVDAEVRAGDRLAIEGENCSLVRGAFSIQIGTAPVVDNDGRHSDFLKSGKVFLPAGLQPVRLAWYNRLSNAVLNLEWEGPGFQRQKVPGTVLWRKPPGVTNLSGLERGLDFLACNGDGDFLADYENRKPVAQGVATNFDISYRVRPEYTALFFSGRIETPRAGVYTFYLRSDDGSRLRIGEPSVSCTRLSPIGASVPKAHTLSQARAETGGSSWIELEGEVTFVGANREHLEIDLATEESRVAVTVVEGATLLSANLLHKHIRVGGICEYSREEKKMASIVVPSSEQVEILGSGSEDPGAASTNPLLTAVAQVRQLKPEQVVQGIPVRMKGVLIGNRYDAFMLHDSTGGMSVHFNPPDWADKPRIGEMVEVEGVTGPGQFAPVIIARKVRRLGNGPMPEPIRPRWDQLMNGSLDCEYVEVQGILIDASSNEMTLYTGDGKVTVGGNFSYPQARRSLFSATGIPFVGSLVRLRGCFNPEWDGQARHVIRGRFRLSPPVVDVEEPEAKDPFSLPTRKIAELLWFDARASALQRTKLKGQIIHAQSGEYLALEEQRGFRILTATPTNLQAGDFIEAVGFPKLDGPSPILAEAQIQKTGHAPLPAPVPVPPEKLLDRNHDSTLVEVEATLVGETIRSKERILELQAGARHFLAVKDSGLDSSPRLAVGSRLRLVGVYASASANHAETSTDPFSLLLINSVEAVTVLERPSWWTPQHALIVATLLAGALGLAFVWITLLRQKVEKRTAQLRKEIEERQRVEKDHAIEQERTRVAQDLHDELGAGLTTVGILGALMKNPATSAENKEGYLEQITTSAHSLVTALDEIVWAVNPQHDSIASLAEYYAYFAQPFLNAAGIACRLEIAESFSEHRLDPRLRHGVFLAFKEALNNVVRHSAATEVRIKITAAGEQLIIAITDNGHGMDPTNNQMVPGQDGMAGMRDRLARLGGSCWVTSQAGQGTAVEFRLPLPPLHFDHDDGTHPESPVDAAENKL
jgi:signal transduction histidine kinase